MRRLATAAVLLVLIALITFWIRSYGKADYFGFEKIPRYAAQDVRTLVVITGSGGICVALREAPLHRSHQPLITHWLSFPNPTYPIPANRVMSGFLVFGRVGTPAPASMRALSPVSSPPARRGVDEMSDAPAPLKLSGAGITRSSLLPSSNPSGTPTFRGTTASGTFVPNSAPPFGKSSPYPDWSDLPPAASPPPAGSRFIAYRVSIYSPPELVRVVIFPFWSAAGLFSLLVGVGLLPELVVLKRRRRARMGLCVNCGYDLRATPERCPECGATPTSNRGDRI